jgi:hypothetical protein
VHGRIPRFRTTRRARVRIATAACVLVWICVAAPASAAGPAWTASSELPLPANVHLSAPDADVRSIACPGPGSCVAVGTYTDDSSAGRALVAEAAPGAGWRSFELLPPANAASNHAEPHLLSVACGAPASCSAVGDYAGGAGAVRAMVASRTTSGWSGAGELDLPGDSSATPDASLSAVACGAPGSCGVIGSYKDAAGDYRPMAAAQVGGAWSAADAIDLPGDASTPAEAIVLSVACGGSGSCVAVGAYKDAAGGYRPMATVLTSGAWSPAVQVDLPRDADGTAPEAYLATVACPATGSCVAGGSYRDANGDARALTASLDNGGWTAAALPLPAGASASPAIASVDAVACRAPDKSRAVGTYTDAAGIDRTMVASQIGARWGLATRLAMPSDADPASGAASSSSIACGAAGACVMAGSYVDATGAAQRAMTAAQVDGAWSAADALPLPAGARSANPDALPTSVSCGDRWSCVAAGSYTDTAGSQRVLLAGSGPAADPAPPAGSPAPTAAVGAPAPVARPSAVASRPAISVKSSRFASAKGVVRIKLACRTARCSGTIKLTTARGKTIVLAQAGYAIARGASRTISVRLTKAGRKAFKHSRAQAVRAKLVISVKGAAATARTVLVR